MHENVAKEDQQDVNAVCFLGERVEAQRECAEGDETCRRCRCRRRREGSKEVVAGVGLEGKSQASRRNRVDETRIRGTEADVCKAGRRHQLLHRRGQGNLLKLDQLVVVVSLVPDCFAHTDPFVSKQSRIRRQLQCQPRRRRFVIRVLDCAQYMEVGERTQDAEEHYRLNRRVRCMQRERAE